MKTSDRVQQLLQLPVNQAPAPARQLVKFLSSKYGLCGETIASGYEAYAIIYEKTEGGQCGEEDRRFLMAIKSADCAMVCTALQQAHQALQRAADHIYNREGHSANYRDAANARDAANNAIIRASWGPRA